MKLKTSDEFNNLINNFDDNYLPDILIDYKDEYEIVRLTKEKDLIELLPYTTKIIEVYMDNIIYSFTFRLSSDNTDYHVNVEKTINNISSIIINIHTRDLKNIDIIYKMIVVLVKNDIGI